MLNLNTKILSGLQIPEVSPERQDKIVSTLCAYDDLIENNRRRIQLLEQAARLLYKEWFVHLRFPGHEHVTITDGVPEGWSRSNLSVICPGKEGIQTGPFGSQLHQSDYSHDGVPVVMPQDLRDLRVSTEKVARVPESLADKLSRHRLKLGDIVYGRRGDIGRRALIGNRQVGFLCGTGCLRLRPDAAIADPVFLYQALGERRVQEDIRNRAKGSTMPNLSSRSMGPVTVAIPPGKLQREFSLHARTTIDQIELLEKAIEKAANARDLLLPRLMNGEIAV
jgi:type I restriction enzyme S subunit